MYKLIAIAGTFDRLHKGHQYFIRQAFSHGSRVIIGLTSNEFTKSKVKSQKSKLQLKTQNYHTRNKELDEFLKREKLLGRAEIIKIDDLYGPAINPENKIEALVVTKETKIGATEVNKKRIELGLKPLKLIVVLLIKADDDKRIASTRIRLGEIDRWGHLYKCKIQNAKSKIDEKIRMELKKPQGVLIKGDINNLKKIIPQLQSRVQRIQPAMIISVGDEVTRICNKARLTPKLSIFDYKVNRKEKYCSLEELGFYSVVIPSERSESRDLSTSSSPHTREIPRSARNDRKIIVVENPPGHITKEIVNAVNNAYIGIIKDNNQRIIQVIGEDDLAGVPAILLSPLGSVVIYGQPGEGVVVVEVTEEKKKKISDLVEKYS